MLSLDALGELLIQIRLLSENQWRKARQRPGADADLAALLHRLRKLPAWWDRAGSAPALTDYQVKWIKRLAEKDQTKRLKKTLRLDRYLILRQLGEGGMGVVYKAWDLTEERLVALKRIKGGSIDTQRRFRREARIQKHLSHPYITRFLRLVRSPHTTLLVLEYIEGRTLAQEVKARGTVPWPEAVRWIQDVLCALDYVHRLKIIHRDLKPSNIMLHKQSAGTIAKLLDLGLAKCLDPTSMTQTATKDALTVGDALLGTFEYMAPEQWRGAEDIVPASDVYSLGCSLFFALTGGPPFVANSLVAYCNAHTNTPPPPLPALQPSAPAALNDILRQMLSKKTVNRPSPAELLRQFGNLLEPGSQASINVVDGHGGPAREVRPTPSAPRTPIPKQATTRPVVPLAPADDRFAPFPPSASVNVAGWRPFWRALFLSRGLFFKVLLLLLALLTAAGVLLALFLT
ncbi:MAG TPA: serine/threonine-protein kinase [Gemmataceae bacterium]|jgi:serine/threonine protein kinase